MKKLLTALILGLVSFTLLSGQESASKANRDAGTASKESYGNETYKINFKLPEGNWSLVKDELALIKTNGKVAEYWNVEKNIRVIVAIEENSSRVIDIADKNIADLLYAFNKIRRIKDGEWFRKGPHYVYFQGLETENMIGEKFKVENYMIMQKDNRNVKVSLFVISPLLSAYENRFILTELYKNFEMK
mgnify:CR=1 FL=1